MKQIKEGRFPDGRRFVFEPEEPTMQSRFSKIAYTMLTVIVWLPQYLWRHLGVPHQPPCPRHGFHDGVTEHDTARPRYYCDMFRGSSGWVVGTVHSCCKCKAEKAKMKQDGDPQYEEHTHYFRTYDPRVTEAYFKSEWRMVAHKMPIRFTWDRGVTTPTCQMIRRP